MEYPGQELQNFQRENRPTDKYMIIFAYIRTISQLRSMAINATRAPSSRMSTAANIVYCDICG